MLNKKRAAILVALIVAVSGVFGVAALTSADTSEVANKSSNQATSADDKREVKGTSDIQAEAESPQPVAKPSQPNPSQPVTQSQPIDQSDQGAEKQAQQAKCDAFKSQYDADVLKENGRHISALAAIDTDYLSRGMGYSGAYQAAKDEEVSKNATNLGTIRLTYVRNKSINICE